MKKVKIKINCQLDFIEIEIIDENGNVKKDKRWKKRGLVVTERMLLKPKARCFDLLWVYAELGYIAQIIPYLN